MLATVARSVKKPVPFRFDASSDVLYFNSKELQEFDPVFYYGCKTKPRHILTKKNIPVSEYLYANFNARNGAWMLSTEECKKAQLLLTKRWVEAHMRSMREEQRPLFSPVTRPREVIDRSYDVGPPVVFVEECLKFRDDADEVVSIEVRGERHADVCKNKSFFKCSDVSWACDRFGLPTRLTSVGGEFVEGIDYVYFRIPKNTGTGLDVSSDTSVELFVTTKGLSRVLSDRLDRLAERLIKWAVSVDRPESITPPVCTPLGSSQEPVHCVGGGGEGYSNSCVSSNSIYIAKEERQYEEAPPPVLLEDHEKFRDGDGNIVEIETLSVDPKNRNENNTFFRCSDVSKGFDMPNLRVTITRGERSGYEENVDYKYFNPHRETQGLPISNKTHDILSHRVEKNQFALYLTYEGLLRVLFVSRNKHVSPFRKWATSILFTHQMGTPDAKDELASKVKGIDLKTFKAVFDTYATNFPCIYLMQLGTVRDLRPTFGIEEGVLDDLVVYKYGFTRDLEKRFRQHSLMYGKKSNVSLRLTTFHLIDTKYTANAENDVRGLMKYKHSNLIVDGYKELVVMSDEDLSYVKQEYGRIGARYAGATSEMMVKIKDLECQLEADRLKHLNDLKFEQNERLLQKERYELEMQKERSEKELQKERYELELQKERYEKKMVEMEKIIVEMERDSYKRERDDLIQRDSRR
jgi:hypothetical protein